MWLIIGFCIGYAVLAAVVAVWSARVCFNPGTKPAVRDVAFEIFTRAWRSGAGGMIGGGVAGVVKLHESGFL
jgi:hypothetical protein